MRRTTKKNGTLNSKKAFGRGDGCRAVEAAAESASDVEGVVAVQVHTALLNAVGPVSKRLCDL